MEERQQSSSESAYISGHLFARNSQSDCLTILFVSPLHGNISSGFKLTAVEGVSIMRVCTSTYHKQTVFTSTFYVGV